MRPIYKERIYADDKLQSSTEYLMEKYAGNPDIYISFTHVDKLGINPQSKYDTPLGIYTYPLKEILEDIISMNSEREFHQSIGTFVPFAGKHPNVWVVTPSSAGKFIKDIGNDFKYGVTHYEKDLKKLEELYLDDFLKMMVPTAPWSTNTHDFWMNYVSGWEDNAYDSSWGGYLWNVTRSLAVILTENGRNGKIPVKWNTIFRNLGYIGVADKSRHGIIHKNEPLQAVFFSKKSIDIIEEIENYERSSLTNRGMNLDKFKLDKFDDELFTTFKELKQNYRTLFLSFPKGIDNYNYQDTIAMDFDSFIGAFNKLVRFIIANEQTEAINLHAKHYSGFIKEFYKFFYLPILEAPLTNPQLEKLKNFLKLRIKHLIYMLTSANDYFSMMLQSHVMHELKIMLDV